MIGTVMASLIVGYSFILDVAPRPVGIEHVVLGDDPSASLQPEAPGKASAFVWGANGRLTRASIQWNVLDAPVGTVVTFGQGTCWDMIGGELRRQDVMVELPGGFSLEPFTVTIEVTPISACP